MRIQKLRQRKKFNSDDRRGAVMVEFAVMLPIFMLLVLGMLEIGAALRGAYILHSAVRGGARLASMDWDDKLAENQTPNEKVEDDIRAFINASGLPGADATISIAHAEGTNEGQTFNLSDEDNDLALFKVEVSMPFSSVSSFPNRYFGETELRAILVQRAGQATLSN